MEEKKTAFTSVDEYIAPFSPEMQEILESLRKTIKQAAPEAQEKISYQMPAFAYNGILVYFAAFKKHIGFYPGANAIEDFKHKLLSYKTSKGAVQFPIEKPLPYGLISEIVEYRLEQNKQKQK